MKKKLGLRVYSLTYTIDRGPGRKLLLTTNPQCLDFAGAPAILDGQTCTRQQAADELRKARKEGAPITIEQGGRDYCEECGDDHPYCQCAEEA